MDDEYEYEDEEYINDDEEEEEEEIIDEDKDDDDDADEVEYDNLEDFTKTVLGIGVKDRITSPYLTRFEKTRIIGLRTEQLSQGIQPFIDVTGMKDPKEIALKEFELKRIPFIVRRYLPNGSYEDWRLDELQ